jgi:hypothetical protein
MGSKVEIMHTSAPIQISDWQVGMKHYSWKHKQKHNKGKGKVVPVLN